MMRWWGIRWSVAAGRWAAYAGVLVRSQAGEEVLAALREIRFSGWLAPPEGDWLVAIAAHGDGTVAAGRRGVIGVGEWLAERLGTTIFAVRVVTDRQLLVVLWADGNEVGRYVSDPAIGFPEDEDVLSQPLGVEYAGAFAAACGHPEAAEDLAEVLAEELDPDSVIESERLGTVLRLLALPRWVVAAAALPHDVPTGPGRAEVTRLGAGVPGLRGRVRGRAADLVRRYRRPPPPPPVADPPRATADVDPWLM